MRTDDRRRAGCGSARDALARLAPLPAGVAAYLLLEQFDPLVLSAGRAGEGLAAGALALATAVMIAVDTALGVARDPQGPRPATVARAVLPRHVSVASAGALFLLARPVIGAAAYPLLLAPLAATNHAFRQLASVRRTFDQTIDALSRIPEIAGYSHAGHARRVRELSKATGRHLRLSDRELEEIEVAAQLHDIGRLQATEPEAIHTLDARALAAGGASVVRTTGALPNVARIIERQHDSYRGSDGAPTANLPTGSQIIRLASAFDDLTETGRDAHGAEEALELLARGRGSRFSPAVYDAFVVAVRQRRASQPSDGPTSRLA